MSIYNPTTKRSFTVCLIGIAIGLGCLPANAQLPTLYDTGVDANHVLLPDGAVDPHYTLISSADPSYPGPNAYVVNSTLADSGGVPIQPGQWFADGPYSKWIAPQANQNDMTGAGPGGDPSGTYEYQTTFNETGNPNTLIITGGWATDDNGLDILVNGHSTGITAAGYQSFTPFTLSGNFVTGLNTLDFLMYNTNTVGTPVNPTGIRVELNAPEPGVTALAATSGLSAFSLLLSRRRQRK